jgi:hypothetical protein
MLNEVREKLHPRRVRVSPKFCAMLACLLEDHWTEPAIAELVITSDGHLLARHEGDCGFNDFIGDSGDLFRNLRGVSAAAGLTSEETEWLLQRAEGLRA